MMNNLKISIFTAAILAINAAIVVGPLFAAELRIIKVAPGDAGAVVRIGAGALQVIRVGDDLGDHGKVIEIAPGRVVLEAHGRAGTETVVIRLQNGRQIVEHIRRKAETDNGLQSTQSSRDAD